MLFLRQLKHSSNLSISLLSMKNVIVIGGAGLLGRVICTKLRTDFNVIVYDILNRSAWDDLGTGTQNYYQADICDDYSLAEVIAKTTVQFDKIDCVINTSYPRNNSYGNGALDVTLKSFNENIKLHLGGYFNVVQQFTKLFIEQGYGNIINIASIQGIAAPKFEHYIGTSMTSPVEYTAAKSAIISISKYFAKFLKGENIRVNCISPGGIINDQPNSFLEEYKATCINKGMLDPEDIIGTIKFLVSDESQYINGQNIIVDDGWSL